MDQKNILMSLPEEPVCVLAHRELGSLVYVWHWFPGGREGARASLKWKTEVFKPRQTRERAQRTEEGIAGYPFSHIVSSDHLFISFPIQQIILWPQKHFSSTWGFLFWHQCVTCGSQPWSYSGQQACFVPFVLTFIPNKYQQSILIILDKPFFCIS